MQIGKFNADTVNSQYSCPRLLILLSSTSLMLTPPTVDTPVLDKFNAEPPKVDIPVLDKFNADTFNR
ncbi:hypothetical protein J6590_008140 [Homalodisca vitripennis]|nr:hypothetical protein J6590_008140 [Homalodisca vitripennis]